MRTIAVLIWGTPFVAHAFLPCEAPFRRPCSSSPTFQTSRASSTVIFVKKLTKVKKSSLVSSGNIAIVAKKNPEKAKPKELTPKQITLALRERILKENLELKNLSKESDDLRSQIKGLEQGVAFIQLASECFGRFIADGKMDSMLFTKPSPDSSSEAVELYRTLAAVKNDISGNMNSLFDKCLTRHGFRLKKIANDDFNKDDFVVSLMLVTGDESESSVEEVVSIIGIMANNDNRDATREFRQDVNTTVRTTLGARERKTEQDGDLEALHKRIRDAEEKIERNDWHMKYIALAHEAFGRYYNDGKLEDIMFTADTNAAVFTTLERLWEKSRDDRELFNSCLTKHGLEYSKIAYTEQEKAYHLTLGLLSGATSSGLPTITSQVKSQA